ncbi:NCS2 family permease [Vagococcus fluvialis]|uniref:NCS2 family permease n=1 Tax=Vagococcus fluvialis TaxID=2738 RepID=UPI001A90B306|nr:NCS2 family permease [Vagococcus fluvialis]MBO0436828.1 NCS2 family permease [Vagococcus fluvialis]
MEFFQDLLAAIGVVINGIPQGILALSLGFAAFPTALAFVFSAAANSITGSVAPISFQVETITVAGSIGGNKRERVSIILWAAVIMTVVGLFGWMNTLVDFMGNDITSGMMTGVGFILARTAISMTKTNTDVGWLSMVTAILVYIFTKDLIYTILLSVVISTLYSVYYKKAKIELPDGVGDQKLSLIKPMISGRILRGSLALACLNIGSNISFGMITGSMTGNHVNIDVLTVVSSVADLISSLFGGAPLESIISATGSAPHPVFSGVLMMVIMAIILATGILLKMGKFVPTESIAGFLFVLGAFVTVTGNIQPAVADNPLVGSVTMVVTALFDPFFGMLAGLAIKFILPIIGVVL